VTEPEIDWRVLQPPTFENQLGWLRIDGRRLWLTLERVDTDGAPELRVSFERQLA
jgi:hypothetical protein